MQSKKVNEIYNYFVSLFGDNPACELNYTNAIECLVAVILSAQCTDKRVNLVTETLFKKYTSVRAFSEASLEELEREIYSLGFYKNKAKNIKDMATDVLQNYGGVLPSEMEQLVKLAGVGRKTASVVLAEYFHVPAIAVDTHVLRISNRLMFTTSQNPVIVEKDLSKLWDKSNWAKYHFLTVLFGRYHCRAQNPACENCKIRQYCSYTGKNKK